MGPPIPVGKIGAEMISSLPRVDIMELKHTIIKALNSGGSFIELPLPQSDALSGEFPLPLLPESLFQLPPEAFWPRF